MTSKEVKASRKALKTLKKNVRNLKKNKIELRKLNCSAAALHAEWEKWNSFSVEAAK